MNKGKVQNPLTIIAIFAGIAEVAGTGVLLGLPVETQRIFVWFVMVFPVVIVFLFFLVLAFKHKVLYAPSDFANEQHFVDLLKADLKAVNQIVSEVKEIAQSKQSLTESDKQYINEQLDVLQNTFQPDRYEIFFSPDMRSFKPSSGVQPTQGDSTKPSV